MALTVQKIGFPDNSIEMGTEFDCLDSTAHHDSQMLSLEAQRNRKLLRDLMLAHGFVPYEKEWSHFTLKDEPSPHTYFETFARCRTL